MIKSILKGVVIGTANVIPGVSGGTMMVAMGIYDKMIHAITHLRKEFRESLRFLFPIGVGVALAIIFTARLIEGAFALFPIQTNFLFCGLIVGSLPMIFGHVRGKTVRPGMIATFFAFFALVTVMALMKGDEAAAGSVAGLLGGIKLFFVGVVAAATMVIPGVSGSMMLMVMGYYSTILSNINGFVSAAADLDISGGMKYLSVLVPFGLGVVVGVILVAKILELIFRKAETHAYYGILGLIFASPLAILIKCDWHRASPLAVLTGAAAFVLGWIAAGKLGREENVIDEKNI